jgi:hypothetical protein
MMRRLLELACLFALSLSIGCHTVAPNPTPPPPPEPIRFGMYAVPQTALTRARELGIDFVIGPGHESYLNAAAAAGLQVIANSRAPVKSPALMGHYLTDEPDLINRSPAEIARDYQTLRAKTKLPIFLNLSSGYSLEAYRETADALMFDWYPVGWQPLETFYAHARVARLAAGRKPFSAVVQAFDWSRYPKQMPASPQFRKPTPAELQAMTVWAAMNGAAGVLFYPYDDQHSRLADSPELAAAITDSILLIKLHEPWFQYPRAWGPYPFKYADPSQTYNAIAEASIAIKYAQAPNSTKPTLLIAANTTAREIKVAVKKETGFLQTPAEISFAPYEVKFFRVASFKTNSAPQ